MSEFDEEAERERLRRKYEQDRQERETTERMSELLLQGATMTNAHCSACGNPVFRYEGQEFCATCEQPVDRDEKGDDDTGVEVTTPDDGRVVFGEESADGASGTDGDGGQAATGGESRTETGATPERDSRGRNADADPDGTTGGPSRAEGGTTGEPSRAEDPSPGTRGDATAPRSTGARTGTAGSTGGESAPPQSTGAVTDASVETARASLVRVLTAASRRAEAADDPRRALEHVELARETAETLATLRQ